MEHPPNGSTTHHDTHTQSFGPTRLISLGILLALLVLCFIFVFTTRDAMQHLPQSRRSRGGIAVRKGLVDQTPWQTIQAIAPLAVTQEETQYAREAERLADHEVDQAFAAALREATLKAQTRTLTGEALVLQQRVSQLQQMVKQDQATVQQLIDSGAKSGDDQNGGTDLDIAKAQLGLDSDQLDDAVQDFNRATGDERSHIQSELSEREAAMKKYDSQSHSDGQTAVISASRYGTLAGRIAAYNRQRARIKLIDQAQQQAEADVKAFTDKHNQLEAQANSSQDQNANLDRAARLTQLKAQATMRQLLSIYDDRIQTEQRLAQVYQKWSDQVELQHRIVLHMMLISCAWVIVILMAMVLGDALIRYLMRYPVLDRRQRQTLRAVLELTIQIVGALSILLFIFGAPQQTPTIVGLTTAALTIALQDFVLSFFGWFVLMGKKGIRMGDLVEINGVGGEVIEIGLMSTTLLETGKLTQDGYPTGRRITFMNSFAIRGQYFNFSTAGQWMLDKFDVTVPASDKMHVVVDAILNAAEQITGDNVRIAEQEWRRVTHGESQYELRASPSVNLRPSGNDFAVELRYVTRASERLETRNKLYRRVIDLLHQPPASA